MRTLVVGLMLVTSTALAGPPQSDGYMLPKGRVGQLGPARRIQKEIPSELNMRVGERQSFDDVFTAGTFSPKVIQIMVSGGVMTILAVGPGQAEVLLGVAKKPKQGADKPTKKLTVKVKS